MNIFEEMDYREILKKGMAERVKIDKRASFQEMAEFIAIQKSYLSRAIHGHVDLNPDQLYMACQFLRFKDEHIEYTLLVRAHSLTLVPSRKDVLRRKISFVQKKNLETKESLSAKIITSEKTIAEYYLDPLNQIVHMSLDIPFFASNPKELIKYLKFSSRRVIESIDTLKRTGFIRQLENKMSVNLDHIHLPRENLLYKSWRNQIRMMSLNQLDNLNSKEHYSFSVTFTGSANLQKNIQAKFIELIKDIEKLAVKCKKDRVIQINFDLFPWLSKMLNS